MAVKNNSSSGLNLQAVRITTGSIAAAGIVDVTVTWPVAFVDSNYSVVAQLLEAGVGKTLYVERIWTRTTTTVLVRVINTSATTAFTGTVHALAVHD